MRFAIASKKNPTKSLKVICTCHSLKLREKHFFSIKKRFELRKKLNSFFRTSCLLFKRERDAVGNEINANEEERE